MTAEAAALGFVLVVCRCAAFVGFAPWLGGEEIPRLVKAGLAVALAMVWFEPLAASSQQVFASATPVPAVLIAVLVAKELLFGAALGYLLRLVVLPARIAGSYVGQEMGLTLATIADPSSPSEVNLMAHLFELMAGVLFFTMDVHHWVLAGLDLAFRLLPIGVPGVPIGAEGFAYQLDMAGEKALLLVAPAAIALFVTTVALTLLTRSVPQLNLFSVGFPVRLVVGISVAAACLPDIAQLLGRLVLQGGAWWLGQLR